MRKISLLFAALCVSLTLTARDFDVVSPSVHTLYCDVVAGGAKIVGWDYPSADAGLINLEIPSHVNNGSANLNVVAIGDSAFMNCNRLVSVVLPTSIRSIGRDAFNKCYGIGSILIPDNVETIGQDAFAFIPNVEYTGSAQGAPWGALAVNAYHEGQYYYTDNSKTHIVCCERDAVEATIPPTVTTIGDAAFACCFNITTIRIDSTVNHVGSGVFGNCASLESVFFNPLLSSGGDYAFADCPNLRQVTIGEKVSKIPLKFCYNCSSLTEINIPDNITVVNSDAFARCTSLESAVLGNGLTQTAVSMFEGCTGLKEVTMSENLQTIRTYTFEGCSSLREIVIPVSVNYINGYAFAGCSGVTRIVCMRELVPVMGDRAFDSIDSGIEVFVPCGKESDYSQDSQWQRFDNIMGKSYYMVVSENNPQWGQAVVSQQPTCDDNTAIIEATPREGCRFVRWDDNNTDNPRSYNYNGVGYAHRQAIFECEVGVEEPSESLLDNPTYLRPNPTKGKVSIASSFGVRTVELFTLDGQMVMSQTVNALSTELNIESVPKGAYVVRITTNKGVVHKKLVKE